MTANDGPESGTPPTPTTPGRHSAVPSTPGANPFDTDEASALGSTASNSTWTVNIGAGTSQEGLDGDSRRASRHISAPPQAYLQAPRSSTPSPLATEITNEKPTSNPFATPSGDLTITPSPESATPPLERVDEKHPEAVAAAAAADAGAAVPAPEPRASIPGRIYEAFRRTYCPRTEPPLVLPTCPDDEEKRLYVHTNRVLLYLFGVLSFLSLGAGMWLFALSGVQFYWYSAIAFFNTVYLAVSYLVGIFGADWKEAQHADNLQAFPVTDDTAPTVDVFLPVCRESTEILRRTWEHVARLDWPAHKLRAYVMDDGADAGVEALAREFGFHYVVRDDRPRLRKAGNLRWTFARTHGELFAIFDADFCPRPDFLRELVVEHLADPRTAIVQSPQFFRVVDEQTWVEKGAGATQELFYRVVQINRNRWGASICVGSNAVYRRAALVDVGGTAEIGFSEDVHTGFGAVDRGWKVKYVPLCLATGVCPNSPRAFFSQQMRWARGSTTLLTNPAFWVSNLSFIQKACYLSGFLYYAAVSLNIFFGPIAGTLLLAIRPEWFKFWNLAFAAPSILFSLLILRVWSKASYGLHVQAVMTVQSYAYLTAIKDRLLGIELLWAASGDAKVHSSSAKYRNMRVLCACWSLTVFGSMVGVVTWRLVNGFPFYHPIPLIVINSYNLFVNHFFFACNW